MAEGMCVGGPYHGSKVPDEKERDDTVVMTGNRATVVYKFRKQVGGVRMYTLPGTSDAAIRDAIRSVQFG